MKVFKDMSNRMQWPCLIS